MKATAALVIVFAETQPPTLSAIPIGTKERRADLGRRGARKAERMGDYENVKAAADLKEYAAQHLTKSRGGAYCCPACGSGTHGGRNSDGALTVKSDGTYWKCHSCQRGGDVFDLAGAIHSTEDKAEQLRIVADWAGVPLEGRRSGTAMNWDDTIGGNSKAERDARRKQAQAGATESATAGENGAKGTDTPKTDYTAGRERHRRYIAECAARLSDGYLAYLNDAPEDEAFTAVADYLEMRGIAIDEACALGIGYDPHPANGWQDEAGNWHNTPRLVLPWLGSDYYHIDRAIDPRAGAGKYSKPKSDEVGGQPLYNPEAFAGDYVIVVEGVIDAIAVQLCGYNAVALGGTAVNDFANEAAARNYSGVVIDMLDCDGHSDTSDPAQRKGRGAGADLVSLLGEAGITTLQRLEYGI